MATKDSNLPLDPDVKVPAAVKRAAAKAESYYPAESMRPVNSPVDPAQPVVPAQVQPAPGPAQEQPAAPEPAPEPPQPAPQPAPALPQPAPQPAPAPPAPPEPPNFEHMYNSMKGRYDASQRTIGGMQEQMSQLGDELMRTQQLLHGGNINPVSTLPGDIKPAFITPDDVKNYGEDLLDVTRRAALEVVTPALSALERENQVLRQQVTQQTRQTIYDRLDDGLANWREVNDNPRWRQWLRLRDFNSSPVRQEQLNRAMSAADAPRVLAFFERFLAEEVATGQMPAPQPPQPQPEPRPAAIQLTTLAAPGRPNPAPGNTQVPDSKPVYTHQDIKDFYEYVRKGVYVGQEALKQSIEADIFAAQREGRVR